MECNTDNSNGLQSDVFQLSEAKPIFPRESQHVKEKARLDGGGGGIRTPGTLSGPTVFKTAGLNRSPTPPFLNSNAFCILDAHL